MTTFNYIKKQLFDWLKDNPYKSMSFNTYIRFINSKQLKLADFYEVMDKLVEEDYFTKNNNFCDNPIYILTEKCVHSIMA